MLICQLHMDFTLIGFLTCHSREWSRDFTYSNLLNNRADQPIFSSILIPGRDDVLAAAKHL